MYLKYQKFIQQNDPCESHIILMDYYWCKQHFDVAAELTGAKLILTALGSLIVKFIIFYRLYMLKLNTLAFDA